MSSSMLTTLIDRRRALQGLLATAATGAALPFLSACTPSAPLGYGHGQRPGEWRNWSGSQSSRPQVFARPADEDALRDLLRAARVRCGRWAPVIRFRRW